MECCGADLETGAREIASGTTRTVCLWAFPAILVLVAVMGTGCVRNEFKIKVRLPQHVNSTYRMSYYASDARGGMQIETAIAVAAGKGEATGYTRYPTAVSVWQSLGDMPAFVFYAERGDEITLTGDSADPWKWKADGNKTNREMAEWRAAHIKLLTDAASPANTAGIRLEHRNELNKALAAYVRTNPDSKAAAVLFYTYYDAAVDPSGFTAIENEFFRNVRSKSVGALRSLFTRQDNMTQTAPPPGGRLKDMVVQSADNNIDTLRFASGNGPVFLYWWEKKEPLHSSRIDSIKKLAKSRKDSSRLIIADIALTADSVLWRNSVRTDSLRHTVRAFSPRGLADRHAMACGVRETPWFTVGDGKGRTLYAGPEIDSAMRAGRKTMK